MGILASQHRFSDTLVQISSIKVSSINHNSSRRTVMSAAVLI